MLGAFVTYVSFWHNITVSCGVICVTQIKSSLENVYCDLHHGKWCLSLWGAKTFKLTVYYVRRNTQITIYKQWWTRNKWSNNTQTDTDRQTEIKKNINSATVTYGRLVIVCLSIVGENMYLWYYFSAKEG